MIKFFLISLFFATEAFSQNNSVGINTSNPDQSAMLDIVSNNKGLLIPRINLQSLTDNVSIAAPARGLIVFNTNNLLRTGIGFYINYGTTLIPQWTTFVKTNLDSFVLNNVYSSTAKTPVLQNIAGGTTVNNIPLGLEIVIKIPASSLCQVIVTYSTALGQTSRFFGGYMGIRFLKNDIEAASGSRKYTIPTPLNTPSANMVTAGATYVETIVNNGTSDLEIKYSLNGYIEMGIGTGDTAFRFNMWDVEPNANFNWGRGSISGQVFAKPLQ